jgi:hypothetical protein
VLTHTLGLFETKLLTGLELGLLGPQHGTGLLVFLFPLGVLFEGSVDGFNTLNVVLGEGLDEVLLPPGHSPAHIVHRC